MTENKARLPFTREPRTPIRCSCGMVQVPDMAMFPNIDVDGTEHTPTICIKENNARPKENPMTNKIEFHRERGTDLKGTGPVLKARKIIYGANGYPSAVVEIHGYGADDTEAFVSLLRPLEELAPVLVEDVVDAACEVLPLAVVQGARKAFGPGNYVYSQLSRALSGES